MSPVSPKLSAGPNKHGSGELRDASFRASAYRRRRTIAAALAAFLFALAGLQVWPLSMPQVWAADPTPAPTEVPTEAPTATATATATATPTPAPSAGCDPSGGTLAAGQTVNCWFSGEPNPTWTQTNFIPAGPFVGTGGAFTAVNAGTTPVTGTIAVSGSVVVTFTYTILPTFHLVFSTQPGGGWAGSLWLQQPTVQVRNSANQVVVADNSSSVNLTITTNLGGGALSCAGATSRQVTNGVAAFSGCSISASSSSAYTLSATSSAGYVPATSAAFYIAPALPTTASSTVAAAQSTSSKSYSNLASNGPSVIVSVGGSGKVLITLTGGLKNNTNDASTFMGFTISGQDHSAANDALALVFAGNRNDLNQASVTYMVTGLTPGGADTFTTTYRVASGTGTFQNRSIIVVAVP